MEDYQKTVDVIVIGSGAGGMTTALMAHDLGLKTIILEKSHQYGGSSAMSGGAIWIPNNHLMAGVGISDSEAEGLTYLKHIVGDRTATERLEAYIEQGPKMVKYLAEKSDLLFDSVAKYCDYYAEVEGGKEGGRSLEPKPLNGLLLKEDFDKIRPPHPQELAMGRYSLTAFEAHKVTSGTIAGQMAFAKIMLKYWLNVKARLKYKRSTRLTLGNALIGRLRLSLKKRNIPIWLNTEVQELLTENGKVVGVSLKKAGKKMRVKAEKAVVLAAGGFSRNAEMRKTYQPKPTSTEWASGNLYNTGDGIRMGMKLGADINLMDDSWWTPAVKVPNSQYSWLLVVEKSMPYGIMVNQNGERFMNEAAPYIDVVNDMYKEHSAETPSIPAYLVFDARFRRKYPCGPLLPSIVQPDRFLSEEIKTQFLNKADSLSELANKINVNPENLVKTVKRFNEFAKTGKDLDFKRGDFLSDRYYSDPTAKPNPCLGSIAKAPFYAVKVWPGDLGTKGGLKTDENARVLTTENEIIAGLYAIGNCSASVMGNTYPGAGGTIGPAMTFGYIAAHHIAKNE